MKSLRTATLENKNRNKAPGGRAKNILMTPLQKILNSPVLSETPQKAGTSTAQESSSFDNELAGNIADLQGSLIASSTASASAETSSQKFDTARSSLQSAPDIESFTPMTFLAASESETSPFPESEDLLAPPVGFAPAKTISTPAASESVATPVIPTLSDDFEASETPAVSSQKSDDITREAMQDAATVQAPAFTADGKKVRPPYVPPETSISDFITPENEVLLDLYAPKLGVKGTIFTYSPDDEQFALPLRQVFEGLDFPVKVNLEEGTATGWFIKEGRNFDLSVPDKTINVDGKNIPWVENAITLGEDDIYMQDKLLSELIPVDFKEDTGNLYLIPEPRETLPIEEKEQRRIARENLFNRTDRPILYPVEEQSWPWLGWPVADFTVNSRLRSSDTDPSTRYYGLGNSDLAKMSAEYYVSGSDEEPLETARLKLSRFSTSSDLLGPLKAKTVSVGDVRTADVPLISGANERGAYISNSDLYQSNVFDTTFLEGDVLPGWDVELYRNDFLIGSQEGDDDGRYDFSGIPVNFGKNDFKVIAYGPQGQVKVLKNSGVEVGGDMLKPGEIEYGASVSEIGEHLFNPTGTSSSQQNGLRASGSMQYGISKELSLSGGAVSILGDEDTTQYIEGGAAALLSGTYHQGNLALDSLGGSSLSLNSLASINEIKYGFSQQWINNFHAPLSDTGSTSSSTSISASQEIDNFRKDTDLQWSLGSTYESTDSGNSTLLQNNLSLNFEDFSFYNGLNWNPSESLTGSMGLNSNFRGDQVSGGLSYDLTGDEAINAYNLSWRHRWNGDISQRFSVDYSPEDELSTANTNFNLKTDYATISPAFSINSENDWEATVALSFSLGIDPASNMPQVSGTKRAGHGAASVLVYDDKNNNRIFDEGDEPIPEVTLRAVQGGDRAKTGQSGIATLDSLHAFKPTDIEIVDRSLIDPYWAPSIPGKALLPRPGHMEKLEFPVVTTGEIDGTITVKGTDGREEVLSNVEVEVVDSEGKIVRTTTTESDGFYLFEKVFPGEYTLRVKQDPDNPDNRNLQLNVEIGNDGTISSGNDFVFPTGPMLEENTPQHSDSRSSERQDVIAAAETPEYPAAHPQASVRSVNEAAVAAAETAQRVEQVVAAANSPATSPLEKSAAPVVRHTSPAELLARAMERHPMPHLRRPTPAGNPLMSPEMAQNAAKTQEATVAKVENSAPPLQPIGSPIEDFVVIEKQVSPFSPLENTRLYASTVAAQYRRIQESA